MYNSYQHELRTIYLSLKNYISAINIKFGSYMYKDNTRVAHSSVILKNMFILM